MNFILCTGVIVLKIYICLDSNWYHVESIDPDGTSKNDSLLVNILLKCMAASEFSQNLKQNQSFGNRIELARIQRGFVGKL